jgi:hypothetical protein
MRRAVLGFVVVIGVIALALILRGNRPGTIAAKFGHVPILTVVPVIRSLLNRIEVEDQGLSLGRDL